MCGFSVRDLSSVGAAPLPKFVSSEVQEVQNETQSWSKAKLFDSTKRAVQAGYEVVARQCKMKPRERKVSGQTSEHLILVSTGGGQ